MLKLYYKWRYNRSQRAGSFKLPNSQFGRVGKSINLSSYLNQDSVRGRAFDRFDLPNRSKRRLKALLFLGSIALLAWLTYESLKALAFFN